MRPARQRQQLASDPYRPIYHYVNPEHTLNDPNGLCYWQGRWHLFYQAHPREDPRQHWGHAISDEMKRSSSSERSGSQNWMVQSPLIPTAPLLETKLVSDTMPLPTYPAITTLPVASLWHTPRSTRTG